MRWTARWARIVRSSMWFIDSSSRRFCRHLLLPRLDHGALEWWCDAKESQNLDFHVHTFCKFNLEA
jgi:hypothetical protein